MSVAKPTALEVAARTYSEPQLEFHLREFETSIVKGYLLLLLSKEIQKEYLKVDDLPEENLKKLQGKISALKWLHTITEQNFQNQPKKHEKDN